MTSYNNKRKLFALLLCLSFYSSIAQNISKPKAIKSETFNMTIVKDIAHEEYTSIFGLTLDSMGNSYLIKKNPKRKSREFELQIEIFDSQLKLLVSNSIDILADISDKYSIEKFVTLDNIPTLFYSHLQTDVSKRSFYYIQFNIQGNISRSGNISEIFSKKNSDSKFELISSKNNNSFMVIAYPILKYKANMTATCHVYNSKIAKLKSFEVDFNYQESHIMILNWTLTEEGIPFCLLGIKDYNSRKLLNTLTMYKNPEAPIQFDLYRKENKISELKISLEENDEITFVGNYIAPESMLSQGVIFLKISKTDYKIKTVKSYQFSKETLKYFDVKYKKILTKDGISSKTPFWTSASNDKNSYLVLGKPIRNITQTPHFSTSTSSFILIKFSQNGDLLFEKIHQFEIGASDGDAGVLPHFFTIGEDIGILHNNVEKTVKKIENGIESIYQTRSTYVSHLNNGLGKYGDINLYIQAFDPTGQNRFIKITDHKVDEISLTNSAIWSSSNNAMICCIFGDKKYGLMKFNF